MDSIEGQQVRMVVWQQVKVVEQCLLQDSLEGKMGSLGGKKGSLVENQDSHWWVGKVDDAAERNNQNRKNQNRVSNLHGFQQSSF